MTDTIATPPPNVEERKAFPADRLMKLAAAREKAIEVRKRNAMLRRKDELERINAKLAPSGSAPTPDVEPASEVVPESKVVDADIPAPVSEDEQPASEPKVVVKKKKPKKQTIVVEQSSDDSDEFESNQNIVFVKRVRKKKENIPPPEPPRVPEPTPEQVRPPPPPQLTQEQQQIQSLYNTMFSGGFTSGPRFGRR